MIQLRPYQLEGIETLNELFREGFKRPILCMPTGAGKTVTFCAMAARAYSKSLVVWVVVDRTELKMQAEDTLEAFNLSHIPVHMVETLCKRDYPAPDLIIIDECHIGNFRKLVDKYPNTRMVGVTATPISSNKKKPLNTVFDSITVPITITQLINQGDLCQAAYVIPESVVMSSELEKDSKGEYTEKSQDKAFGKRELVDGLDVLHFERGSEKSILFASSVDKVIEIAGRYPNSIPLHSKMNKEERRMNVARFRASKSAWLINCGIATRGFDEPGIMNVILFRKTTSLALYLQMVGRGSRPIRGVKDTFTVIDFGGNVDELGLWELERDWKAIFEEVPTVRKKKSAGLAPHKQCKECDSIIPMQAKVCEFCQAPQNVEQDILIATKLGDPIIFGKIPPRLQKPFAEMTVRELMERAKYGSKQAGRPYKDSWVVMQLKQRGDEAGIREYAEIKGYKSGWIWRQMQTIS